MIFLLNLLTLKKTSLKEGHMKRACLLLAILSCATSVNACFNCWDEAEAVVCKDYKTGQIIRRTVDPSGVITYRNNRGQRIHVHEGRFGERVFKNEYGRQNGKFNCRR